MWRASPKNAHTHAIIVSLLTVHTPLTHQAVQDEEPEPEPLVKPLPYNPGSLSWNERHTQNAENTYCYCGKPRTAQELALRCHTCNNWVWSPSLT